MLQKLTELNSQLKAEIKALDAPTSTDIRHLKVEVKACNSSLKTDCNSQVKALKFLVKEFRIPSLNGCHIDVSLYLYFCVNVTIVFELKSDKKN